MENLKKYFIEVTGGTVSAATSITAETGNYFNSIVFDKQTGSIWCRGVEYGGFDLSEVVLSDAYVVPEHDDTKTEAELQPAIGDQLDTVIGKLMRIILDNEAVSAAALNDLNDRTTALEDSDIVSGSAITVATATTDEGVRTFTIGVNVDGTTVKVNDDNKLEVVSSAITTYEGEKAITITEKTGEGVVNTKTVALKINADDKVLTQDTDGLKTTVTLNFVPKTGDDNAKLQILGAEDAVVTEIDASAFVVDGMLDKVEVVEISGVTYLQFTFNTDAGKEVINVEMSRFFSEYKVGSGSTNYLEITKDDTETSKNLYNIDVKAGTFDTYENGVSKNDAVEGLATVNSVESYIKDVFTFEVISVD